MPWTPTAPGEVPTLGHTVLDWIETYLAAPDRADYEPFLLYEEQAEFVLRLYELDPVTGRRKYRRAVLSRPRGWGKSPLLAALAAVEALGPVVPDGWDAYGQPVGMPWSEVRTPLVHVAAVSEGQTANTWTPLGEMLDGPVLDAYPGVEPLDTFINLPRGRIEPITSSARTVKGARPVFAVLDQTEEWVPSNGGPKLAETMRINAAKVGGATVETPNAYTPGEESVAEASAAYWEAITEGKARDDGLFYAHREAPADTELTERDSLLHGLRVVYGDSAGHPDGCLLHDPPCPPGHVDLDRIAADIWDPDISPQRARADFLNQITHASDALVSAPEWRACHHRTARLAARDVVTLGFDGSRGRAKGKPDATALVACRVLDGHLFTLGVWEAGDDPRTWPDWSPPIAEIEAAIDEAFARFDVVAAYFDPARDWRSHVNAWEARHGARVKVPVSRDHPLEWWMTGGRATHVERAVEAFESAVRNEELSHDGGLALTRHVLNARRRVVHKRLSIGKPHEYSDRKVDACVAATLAWQARLDAIARGISGRPARRRSPRRIR